MEAATTAPDTEQEPTGFVIDGNTYPVPKVGSFDMDEAQIFTDYGYWIEDFIPDQDGGYSSERVEQILHAWRSPAYKRALMVIAYRREHPDVPLAEIKALTGKVSSWQVLDAWVASMEDDASPPAQESTSEQTRSSVSGSDDSNGSSGPDSETTTGEPVVLPVTTGAT